jgi:LysM repeat protein
MANVSNNYSALFGSTAKAATPAANTAVPATASPALPAQPSDTVSLSASAVPAANAPAATAAKPTAEDMKKELAKLRQELDSINKQIDLLMKALDAQAAAPTTPTTQTTDPKPAAEGGTHKVETGDYLWKIAKEKLGDAKRWPEIYELNKDAIGENPNLLYPGMTLKMPGEKTTEATPPATTPATPPTNTTPPATTPPTNTTPAPTTPVPTTPVPTTPVPTTPPAPATDATDVPLVASNRNLADADVARIAQEFGLAPDKANVSAFLDEMDSYEGANKGKVFGPGMENVAANDEERNRIKQSVMQIQQAFNLLIKAGKLKPMNAQGQAVGELPLSGTFFKVDAQGKEVKDAQGNPTMDDAFIAAITQFKQDNQIHQNYKLSDGSYAINEYVGPTTIEYLKKALTGLQG